MHDLILQRKRKLEDPECLMPNNAKIQRPPDNSTYNVETLTGVGLIDYIDGIPVIEFENIDQLEHYDNIATSIGHSSCASFNQLHRPFHGFTEDECNTADASCQDFERFQTAQYYRRNLQTSYPGFANSRTLQKPFHPNESLSSTKINIHPFNFRYCYQPLEISTPKQGSGSSLPVMCKPKNILLTPAPSPPTSISYLDSETCLESTSGDHLETILTPACSPVSKEMSSLTNHPSSASCNFSNANHKITTESDLQLYSHNTTTNLDHLESTTEKLYRESSLASIILHPEKLTPSNSVTLSSSTSKKSCKPRFLETCRNRKAIHSQLELPFSPITSKIWNEVEIKTHREELEVSKQIIDSKNSVERVKTTKAPARIKVHFIKNISSKPGFVPYIFKCTQLFCSNGKSCAEKCLQFKLFVHYYVKSGKPLPESLAAYLDRMNQNCIISEKYALIAASAVKACGVQLLVPADEILVRNTIKKQDALRTIESSGDKTCRNRIILPNLQRWKSNKTLPVKAKGRAVSVLELRRYIKSSLNQRPKIGISLLKKNSFNAKHVSKSGHNSSLEVKECTDAHPDVSLLSQCLSSSNVNTTDFVADSSFTKPSGLNEMPDTTLHSETRSSGSIKQTITNVVKQTFTKRSGLKKRPDVRLSCQVPSSSSLKPSRKCLVDNALQKKSALEEMSKIGSPCVAQSSSSVKKNATNTVEQRFTKQSALVKMPDFGSHYQVTPCYSGMKQNTTNVAEQTFTKRSVLKKKRGSLASQTSSSSGVKPSKKHSVNSAFTKQSDLKEIPDIHIPCPGQSSNRAKQNPSNIIEQRFTKPFAVKEIPDIGFPGLTSTSSTVKQNATNVVEQTSVAPKEMTTSKPLHSKDDSCHVAETVIDLTLDEEKDATNCLQTLNSSTNEIAPTSEYENSQQVTDVSDLKPIKYAVMCYNVPLLGYLRLKRCLGGELILYHPSNPSLSRSFASFEDLSRFLNDHLQNAILLDSSLFPFKWVLVTLGVVEVKNIPPFNARLWSKPRQFFISQTGIKEIRVINQTEGGITYHLSRTGPAIKPAFSSAKTSSRWCPPLNLMTKKMTGARKSAVSPKESGRTRHYRAQNSENGDKVVARNRNESIPVRDSRNSSMQTDKKKFTSQTATSLLNNIYASSSPKLLAGLVPPFSESASIEFPPSYEQWVKPSSLANALVQHPTML